MEGGCHCKAIRFEVTGDPEWIGACYCIDCRKISGSPYMVFAEFPVRNVTVHGTPKAYRSSEKVLRSFCDTCGSPFSYAYVEKPDHLFISVGLFDDASGFAPKHHIFTEQKLSWVDIPATDTE